MKKSLQIADKRSAARRRRFQREHLARRHAWDACRHTPPRKTGSGAVWAFAPRVVYIGAGITEVYWAGDAAVPGMVYFDEVADVPAEVWLEP